MKVISIPQPTVLRFDPGEEVIGKLTAFAREQKLAGAAFTAIGATGEVTLSYYDLQEKKYDEKTFAEQLEIIALTGNIAWLGDEPVVHAHGVFSDRKMAARAGHVKKLVVSATCEVSLWPTSAKLAREKDETTGLNLLA